ncbi:MAG: hypothetical protein JJE05_08450 [Actinobacteria bacterium]|nr:hypothetical protein [Actinomycetota bacterium]
MTTGRATILWAKAPLLLRRFPQILGITILASAILAIATASGPTFLKASETASLSGEIEESTVWAAGLRVSYRSSFSLSFLGLEEASQDVQTLKRIESSVETAIADEIEGVPHLGEVSTTLVGAISRVSRAGEEQVVRLIHRDDALDHVEKIAGTGNLNRGVWLADVTAEVLGVEPGDRISLSGPTREGKVRVAGTYRFLPLDVPRAFWQGFGELIYQSAGDMTYPPAFAIVPGDDYYKLAVGAGDLPTIRWEVPSRCPSRTWPQSPPWSKTSIMWGPF